MTKMRLNKKFSIVLGLALFFSLILNFNTANAAEEKNIDEIADFIKKQTISVDASSSVYNIYEKESIMQQCSKVANDVYDKLFEKCTANNMINENLSISIWLYGDTLDYAQENDIEFNANRLYRPRVTVNVGDDEIDTYTNVVFSDNKNYDKDIAQKIKKAIDADSSKYIVVDFEKLAANKKDTYDTDKWYELASEYYKELLNDSNIQVTLNTTAGETKILNDYPDSPVLNIFRNNVYYGSKSFFNGKSTITKIIVPNSVKESDEEYIKYAKTILQKYLNDSNVSVKYLKNDEGYKLYTVTGSKEYGTIIIEKEKTKVIETTDKDTNIKLDTTTDVVPEGTILVANEIKSGDNYNIVLKAVEKDVDKFVLYDISLLNNNVKIQPNGLVKISIPVPENFDSTKIVVYRVLENGTKTKLDVNIQDKTIVFETDHFSNYVIAEEKTISTNSEEENTKTEGIIEENTDTNTNVIETTTDSKRELDNTPKTGDNIASSIVIATICIIVAFSIIIIKKI